MKTKTNETPFSQQRDLTKGSIAGKLLLFALPMMAGNLMQQLYNIADTWVVGQFIGPEALAAVGSSYTLMVFLTSIFTGLCMGSGVAFSIYYGKKDMDSLKSAIFMSFTFIAGITILMNVILLPGVDMILGWLQVPADAAPYMREYLQVIFWGLVATFAYNYFASLLRAVGNSLVPLIFLGVSVPLNICLDLFFVLVLRRGVRGAAEATVISQGVSAVGIAIYTWCSRKELRPQTGHMRFRAGIFKEILSLSFLTCVQQSVMNLGILMVQGLINSFGTMVMAGYAAAVKIDSFAYMPAQDFGNAFATFVAQNYGAGEKKRIQKGGKIAAVMVCGFCICVGIVICFFARPLMGMFVTAGNNDIIEAGAGYLRVVAACYPGIGFLFLFYAYYRAIRRPGFSVILTVISLGTRVALAYWLSSLPFLGVWGIWISIPIGWALADITGLLGLGRKTQWHSERGV